MSSDEKGHQAGADCSKADGIPDRLVKRMNPAVLEDRQTILKSRLLDVGRRRLLRERSYEIAVKNLLEVLNAA